MTKSFREFCRYVGSNFAVGFKMRTNALMSAYDIRSQASLKHNEQRALVIIYLGGGNDGLSFVQPYLDQQLKIRRPTISLDPASVLQIGEDQRGKALGFHPSLRGLKTLYDRGQTAVLQRVGYEQASRSHFLGSDIMSSASPDSPQGHGWLARYMEGANAQVDPLFAWNTQFQVPRSLAGASVRPASISDPSSYAYLDPWNSGRTVEQLAGLWSDASTELGFINATTSAAFSTLDRVGSVSSYQPTVDYPSSQLGNSLRLVASAIASAMGTRIFWVQATGYDTHANQGVRGGRYARLLLEFDQAITAFYTDLENQNLTEETLILQYSEFGRRIDENGSAGTDHGAAGTMTVLGGSVRGGVYGSSPDTFEAHPDNPDLENQGFDLRPEIDFRSVYAQVLENWLQVPSAPILGKNFNNSKIAFI